MQELTVIDVQDDALIAVDEDGERYRIAVDDSVRSRLRRPRADADDAARISPREIQAQIRAGLSAAEVAELTGASLEYVERFEGPIVAEREHVVALALAVPARPQADGEDAESTFGAVLRDRLASLSATGERWAAWREPDSGWVVKLSFTADEIDHDARWSFDPRTHTLDPLNAEAITLSQHGELRDGLIPRLRAVTPAPVVDTTRFDSGAFVLEDEHEPELSTRTPAGASNSIAISAIKRAEEPESDQHHTADLLEALRRRRGERETAGFDDEDADEPARPERRARLVELPLEELGDESAPVGPGDEHPEQHGQEPRTLEPAGRPTDRPRRGRAPIPTWDEIVFGARGDDDQA